MTTKLPKLRGHHLFCLHFFSGEGYNKLFIKNLNMVIKEVKFNNLIVTDGADDVCTKCPSLEGKLCNYSATSEKEIRNMDTFALSLLKVSVEGNENWKSLYKLVLSVFPKWYNKYCIQCSWKYVCEKNKKFSDISTVKLEPG